MKTKILVYACVALLSFTSCEDWLSQNDPKELSEDQAYSSVASISSIAANLYERIKLDQNFASDNESYDCLLYTSPNFVLHPMNRFPD